MQPNIAVILATYNGRRFVEEQLASLASQHDVEVHVYHGDDASTDKTAEVVEESSGRLNLRHTRIVGPAMPSGAASTNFFRILSLVSVDDFDFVAFCDQDDIWSPTKLSRAVSAMRATGAAGYSANLVAFDEDRQRAWMLRKDEPQTELDFVFQSASAGCTYVLSQNAARLVQKRLVAIGAPVPNWVSHDWFIYAACRSGGLAWHQDPGAPIFYRQHGHNVYGALPGMSGAVTKFTMMRSGWYRRHILWLADVLAYQGEARRVAAAIERLSLLDRCKLALDVRRFRRRWRDRLVLSFMLLTGLM